MTREHSWRDADTDPMTDGAITRYSLFEMAEQVPWPGVPLIEVTEPSRVAFAGCWHAQADDAIAAMRAAKDAGATVLVHTGDFLYTGQGGNYFCFKVEQACKDLGLTLVVIRGNHDNPETYAKAAASARRRKPVDGFARITPRILHAPNGMRWTWQGVDFVALGGAASVDRPARREGISWWPDEVASTREVNRVIDDGAAHVMVTHDIPLGSDFPFMESPPSWWDLDAAYAHHTKIAAAVDAVQPDWVIAGHMHHRHSGHVLAEGGKQVRLEVLDKGDRGPAKNLLVADLTDGTLVPVH